MAGRKNEYVEGVYDAGPDHVAMEDSYGTTVVREGMPKSKSYDKLLSVIDATSNMRTERDRAREIDGGVKAVRSRDGRKQAR